MALFTTGIIAAQLIPIVIAVVAVTAAALVVGCATYALLKPRLCGQNFREAIQTPVIPQLWISG